MTTKQQELFMTIHLQELLMTIQLQELLMTIHLRELNSHYTTVFWNLMQTFIWCSIISPSVNQSVSQSVGQAIGQSSNRADHFSDRNMLTGSTFLFGSTFHMDPQTLFIIWMGQR